MAGKLNPVKLVLQQVSAARLEVLTHIPPPDSDWNRTIFCSGLLLAFCGCTHVDLCLGYWVWPAESCFSV